MENTNNNGNKDIYNTPENRKKSRWAAATLIGLTLVAYSTLHYFKKSDSVPERTEGFSKNYTLIDLNIMNTNDSVESLIKTPGLDSIVYADSIITFSGNMNYKKHDDSTIYSSPAHVTFSINPEIKSVKDMRHKNRL